jgi:hypothetical protein
MKNAPKVAVSMVRMTGPAPRATDTGMASSASVHTTVTTSATAGRRYRHSTVHSSTRDARSRFTAGHR